ncbi:DUF1853 family protein [Chromobacterium alticapitis]|uniref:DUF1853 domain-containing protein n=1 Tax=Chromobacterium alticapitis TaxID=2073169 RepID=A0A2S5DLU0_9NEIS|nr:DUF1853 family protein [Chromobacterium alticapitis]POZ64020.1 DUF1853 domain-containing protein [Chromobacterium alticapitis]
MRTEPGYELPYAHPAVRDLAFLLTSPSPWLCGADFPPERLLGLDGAARLAELDRSPAALEAWLAAAPATRLGKYAERLYAFWFRHAPHIELVAENLQVLNRERRVIGEFDFLLRLDGEPWHLETASKFYLQTGDTLEDLIGPGLNDAWRLKETKNATQLRLSRHPDALPYLPAGFERCRAASRLSGWFFYPADQTLPTLLSPGQLHGWHAPLQENWPRRCGDSRWAWLPRLSWLAPARLDESRVQNEPALREQLLAVPSPQLVAELRPGADGAWHEAARVFATPPGWPDPSRLAALRQRVAAART